MVSIAMVGVAMASVARVSIAMASIAMVSVAMASIAMASVAMVSVALAWSRQSCARSSCHTGRFSEVSTPTLCSSWSCNEIPAAIVSAVTVGNSHGEHSWSSSKSIPPGTAHASVAVRASSRMSSRFSRSRPSETHRVPSPQKASKW